jgi:hypothetical protein
MTTAAANSAAAGLELRQTLVVMMVAATDVVLGVGTVGVAETATEFAVDYVAAAGFLGVRRC